MNFRLGFFAWELSIVPSLENFAWDRSLGDFRLRDLPLGKGLSLEFVRLRLQAFARELSLDICRLVTFPWELLRGTFA